MESKNSAFNGMINELEVLKDSKQVYDVVISDKYNTDNEYWAGTGFNTSNGNVEIIIPTGAPPHLVAHEFKHAYQFEKGLISISNNPDGFPIYDITDEIDAYERSSLVSNRNESKSLLNPLYDNLPKEPASIESFIKNRILIDSSDILQKQAQQWRCVFRWDGKTYNGIKSNN